MSIAFSPNNPFIPANVQHRAAWPVYQVHVDQKVQSLRNAFEAWTQVFGRVPLKLHKVKRWRFSEPLFDFSTVVPHGNAADDLDEIVMDHGNVSLLFNPMGLDAKELELVGLLGLTRNDGEAISALFDRMEQYENYVLCRELFEYSDVRETLQKNGTEFSYEQLWHSCNIVVPDAKDATYLKLSFG